jgi:hypothetical protein
VRADVDAVKLAGGGRRSCARVGEQRPIGEERRGASEKRGASGKGAVRRDDDDDGEERRRRGEEIWGKRLSADLEGDGAYIEPPTFCHGSSYQP